MKVLKKIEKGLDFKTYAFMYLQQGSYIYKNKESGIVITGPVDEIDVINNAHLIFKEGEFYARLASEDLLEVTPVMTWDGKEVKL